jgi:hypothetical protein
MNIATDQVFSNISPNSSGQIVITFAATSGSPDQNAKVDAIQIVPQGTAAAVKALRQVINAPTPTVVTGFGSAKPGVSALPNISKDGQPVLFKINSDVAQTAQLTIYNVTGEKVYQTSFVGNSFLWNLENQSNAPVASGLYLYVLRAGNGSQVNTYEGKIIVVH